jgi:hypothetical protein
MFVAGLDKKQEQLFRINTGRKLSVWESRVLILIDSLLTVKILFKKTGGNAEQLHLNGKATRLPSV